MVDSIWPTYLAFVYTEYLGCVAAQPEDLNCRVSAHRHWDHSGVVGPRKAAGYCYALVQLCDFAFGSCRSFRQTLTDLIDAADDVEAAAEAAPDDAGGGAESDVGGDDLGADADAVVQVDDGAGVQEVKLYQRWWSAKHEHGYQRLDVHSFWNKYIYHFWKYAYCLDR